MQADLSVRHTHQKQSTYARYATPVDYPTIQTIQAIQTTIRTFRARTGTCKTMDEVSAFGHPGELVHFTHLMPTYKIVLMTSASQWENIAHVALFSSSPVAGLPGVLSTEYGVQ